jgi:hypothetical protein
VSCKGNHRAEAETVEAKRVQLSDNDVTRVRLALQYMEASYSANADARQARGWSDAEDMWRTSANELLAILAKFDDCDRVELVTDGAVDAPTCPPDHVQSERGYCRTCYGSTL